ncbi:MAG TPA: hypothetical protein VFM05_11740, partial [Candidatus Saccharimonadales bacterium]|nr:hypothetical protein [Candidatus Saccharimonadales bacterium]
FFEWRGEEYSYYIREEGADCSYTCSDGTVRQVNISGTVSTMYSASKAEMDAQFCGVALEPTPTEVVATEPPTLAPSPTLAASPTAAASPTLAETPTLAASPIASPTAQAITTAVGSSGVQGSLLTGRVTMCDTGGNLISFRITQPPPDLTGKTLTAQIGGQESVCYVNATNPSLMTCTIPPGMTFPAPVAVSVDGTVASEFTYSGLGCTEITTPVATTTP